MNPEEPNISQRVTSIGGTIGIVLFVFGVLGQLAVLSGGHPIRTLSGPVSVDFEVLGALIGCCSVVGGRYLSATESLRYDEYGDVDLDSLEPPATIYATRSIVELLLLLAEDADPVTRTVDLIVTPAAELDGFDHVNDESLSETTPVFSHFYMPETARSTQSVFGIDLSVPPGQTQGRFISHPLTELGVSKRDDLHGMVLVAVPPWDETSIAAFDRAGRRYPLEILDVTAPGEMLPEEH